MPFRSGPSISPFCFCKCLQRQAVWLPHIGICCSVHPFLPFADFHLFAQLGAVLKDILAKCIAEIMVLWQITGANVPNSAMTTVKELYTGVGAGSSGEVE